MSTKCHCSIFGRNCEMIIYGTRNVVIEITKVKVQFWKDGGPTYD